MIRKFAAVYRLYRRHHPMTYALSRAWGIVVKGQDF